MCILDDKKEMKKVDKSMHLGVILGSISVFVSMLGACTTFPYLQSQRDLLGCDALCYGWLQSGRSAASLIGEVESNYLTTGNSNV